MSEVLFDPYEHYDEEKEAFVYPEIADREAALAQIRQAPITIDHVDSPDNLSEEIQLALPYGCGIQASFLGHLKAEEGILNIGWLRVPPDLRGAGVGERLVKSCIAYGYDHGAKRIDSAVSTATGIKLRRRLFTEDKVWIADYSEKTVLSSAPLPITLDQAVASLERASEYEKDTEEPQRAFFVSVSVEGTDMREWERPLAQFDPPIRDEHAAP